MNQSESSLEKARAAAEWFHEKVPITAFPSYRTDYVIALLAAYAASAVALEREQRDKEWIAQLMKMRAGYDSGKTVWVELIDPPDVGARGERKGDNT